MRYNHTIDYIIRIRKSKRISYGYIGRALGYKNINKIANKIAKMEHFGLAESGLSKEMFHRILDAIGIDRDELQKMVDLDNRMIHDKFEEEAAKPFDMFMIVLYMAAFYVKINLPKEIKSAKEGLEYAKKFSRENNNLKVWFYASKKLMYIIDQDGSCMEQVLDPFTPQPFMQIGNKRFLFSAD